MEVFFISSVALLNLMRISLRSHEFIIKFHYNIPHSYIRIARLLGQAIGNFEIHDVQKKTDNKISVGDGSAVMMMDSLNKTSKNTAQLTLLFRRFTHDKFRFQFNLGDLTIISNFFQ